jgi:hypothetical protein
MINITFSEFGEMVFDFYDYMGRDKMPTSDRVSKWFHEIKKISSADIRDSFKRMRENLDSLPHNLPKAIKTAVFEISRSKETKIAKFGDFGTCDYCNGSGAFKARVCDQFGCWYEPIYFCGHCDNWKVWTNNKEFQRYKVPELEAMNIRFKPYNMALLNRIPVNTTGSNIDVKNLAFKIGESKRFNYGYQEKGK